MGNMVQYSMWGACSNHCDFCLLRDKHPMTNEDMIHEIRETRKNLDIVDWSGKFSDGISLLGGELFFITDKMVQDEFMMLIEDIIKKILKPVPTSMFSCVTNGIYKPDFLYRVMDRLNERVGMAKVDVNFSYDLKYRFHSEEARKLVIKNVLAFADRYMYKVAVQMILTQHVIDLVRSGKWSPNYLEEVEMPGVMLSFLYPHPIYNGQDRITTLPDFNFKRSDLLWFVRWLKNNNDHCYHSFLSSTKNSGTYKYTGRYHKSDDSRLDYPILSDGKEELAKCGHSILYRCYSDCDKCLLCDLENIAENT